MIIVFFLGDSGEEKVQIELDGTVRRDKDFKEMAINVGCYS